MILTTPKTAFNRFAPDAPLPPSAVLRPPTAQNRSAQARRAGNAGNFTLPQSRIATLRREFTAARPVAFLACLISEANLHTRAAASATELKSSLEQLFERAAVEDWSLRDLSRRAGIPESTLRWLRSGQVDPLAWLPKIQTALARTNPL